MSDAPAAAGGEGALAPAPAVVPSDVASLQSIEGLLEAEEQPRRRREPRQPQAQETQDHPAAEADDARPEEPATGDDTKDDQEGPEPDEPEEEAPPAIDPPVSWKAEDREVFAKLPPEAQQIVARREGERDRYVQQRTQQIAEESRASAMERLREREEYGGNLQKLLFVAAPEAEKFAQIDWQRLAAENPSDYVRLTAERDALRGRIGALQGELQRVDYQSKQERAYLEAQFKQQQMELLAQRLPVVADPDRGPKFARDLGAWLQEQGFSQEEIGQVFDHRAILIAEKAMRADRAAAARKSTVADRAPPPSVPQPPGTKQRSDRTASQRRDAKMAALKKSGSQQDAINYLMEIL
jgi:hypothetical protein